MKQFARLTAVFIVLLAFSGLASAGAPELGPFSTTGYTTNVVWISDPPDPYPPYIAPLQFEQFPSGYYKFHFLAQGGGTEADDTCNDVYGPVYGNPVDGVLSCQQLCMGLTGKACGVAGDLSGSFIFDEVGVALRLDNGTLSGANSGSLKITTGEGVANLKFSGTTSPSETQDDPPISIVTGAFESQKMKGDFKELKSPGSYEGNADYVFTVDYDPCAKNEGLGINDQCAVNRCAVFGDDLKIEKDKVKWKIRNEGKEPITISSVLIHWLAYPPTDPPTVPPIVLPTLKKVKLGGKTLAEQSDLSISTGSAFPGGPIWNWTRIDFPGDDEKDLKDRRIDKNKMEELSLEFDKKGVDISAFAWDYTILVEFGDGCAVPFVAFAPPPPPAP
jgi:hypothetical protein